MDFSPSALVKIIPQCPTPPARICLIRAGARKWIQNRDIQEEIRYLEPFPEYLHAEYFLCNRICPDIQEENGGNV